MNQAKNPAVSNGLVQLTSILSTTLFFAASSATLHSTTTDVPQQRYATSRANRLDGSYLDVPAASTGNSSSSAPHSGLAPGETAVFPANSSWPVLYKDKENNLCWNVLPFAENEWGTGDWFGLRHKLVDTGVNITGGYGNDILANVAGGKKRGVTYADQIYIQIDLDMEKLIGWKGLHIVSSAIDRNGTNMSQRFTGNIFNPNQIYGSETIQLYNLYLEQSLFNDWVDIKAGRMGATDDFAHSPIYGLYVNNGIDGQPAGPCVNGYLNAWPAAVWGARLRVNDKKDHLYAMAGVYQTNARLYQPSYHGVDFGIHRTDGVVLVGEVGWTPEFQPHPKPTSFIGDKSGKELVPASDDEEWHGMQGNYKFGAFYTHWSSIPTFDNSSVYGTYGFYWLFDQMVYQAKPGSECGLTVWGAFCLSPDQRTALVPFQATVGAFYTGLIPGRTKDKTALMALYGGLSDIWADAETEEATSTREGVTSTTRDNAYEIVLEACYTIQVTKYFRVQPDLQYIIHPGGLGRIPNALVIGAQISYNF